MFSSPDVGRPRAIRQLDWAVIRLTLAEFAQRVTAATNTSAHCWAPDYLDAFSETIAGGAAEI